jgi:hypothetical protein
LAAMVHSSIGAGPSGDTAVRLVAEPPRRYRNG